MYHSFIDKSFQRILEIFNTKRSGKKISLVLYYLCFVFSLLRFYSFSYSFWFFEIVFLCSSGCSGIHSVEQTCLCLPGTELKGVCVTTAWQLRFLFIIP